MIDVSTNKEALILQIFAAIADIKAKASKAKIIKLCTDKNHILEFTDSPTVEYISDYILGINLNNYSLILGILAKRNIKKRITSEQSEEIIFNNINKDKAYNKLFYNEIKIVEHFRIQNLDFMHINDLISLANILNEKTYELSNSNTNKTFKNFNGELDYLILL